VTATSVTLLWNILCFWHKKETTVINEVGYRHEL